MGGRSGIIIIIIEGEAEISVIGLTESRSRERRRRRETADGGEEWAGEVVGRRGSIEGDGLGSFEERGGVGFGESGIFIVVSHEGKGRVRWKMESGFRGKDSGIRGSPPPPRLASVRVYLGRRG